MKKYIIAIGLFCLSLFLIEDAYAATSKGWGMDIYRSNIAQAFNCDSSSNCSTTLSTSLSYDTDIEDNFIVGSHYTSASVLTSTNGMMWVFSVNPGLKANYLYSITAYFCNNNSKGYKLIDFVTGSSQGDVGSKKYHPTLSLTGAINKISNEPYYDGSSSTNFTCSYINRVFAPAVDSQYIGYQITTDSSSTGQQLYYGYQIAELGRNDLVTASEVQSILNNSNLASAQSVEEVETAVTEVQQEITVLQQQQQQQHNEMKDTITNSDSSGATGEAGSFFEGFNTDTFGLTSIITAPLNLIQNITSKTCTPLNLQVPFVDKTMQLPCMSTIYQRHFGSFLTVYQTITFGIIS